MNAHGAAKIRPFRAADTEATVALWESCGLTRPWNDPRADISRKLSAQPELFLVAEAGPEPETEAETEAEAEPGAAGRSPAPAIVGSVMAGYDGHRGWMYYLATAQSHRGIGLGRALVAEVELRLERIGCPKVQLMVRSSNEGAVGFYAALGYEDADVRVLGKRLIEDR